MQDYLNALTAFQNGQLESAEQQCLQILKDTPNRPDLLNLLGVVVHRSGRSQEAEEYIEKAIGMNPIEPNYYNNLGLALRAQGKYHAALNSFKQALYLNPQLAESHLNMGNTLQALSMLDESVTAYQEAIRLRPAYIEAFICLGTLYQYLGLLEDSRHCFEEALKINPASLEAIAGVAGILEIRGDFAEAYDKIRPAIETGLDNVTLALVFSRLSRHVNGEAKAITLLERLLAQSNPSLMMAQQMHFALGNLFDAQKEYDKAFQHYHTANELRPKTFNPQTHADNIESIIEAYSASKMAHYPRSIVATDRPVFIVGMLRSGTSLVEQILDSHPHVYGAGELQIFSNYSTDLPKILESAKVYPQCLEDLTQERVNALTLDNLTRLTELHPDAARVTLKNPYNFLHLGLIALVYPHARIIHCVRDPIDTCLSCYFKHFGWNQEHTFDLASLGEYYVQYKRLMQHWKETLDIEILDVQYEDLVTHQEDASRKLINFCGLEWDDCCLRFYENKRIVKTASYDQVRQPMYQKSVARHKHYTPYLGPLLKVLEAHGLLKPATRHNYSPQH